MDRNLMDKIQKLTAAVYRVTDLYPDKEPLKWTLRDKAIVLYTKFMSIMSERPTADSFGSLLNSLSNIIGMLEVASLGDEILNINFEILKKEYIKLKDILERRKDSFIIDQEENKVLIPEFLKDKKDDSKGQIISKGQNSKGQKKKIENYEEKIINFLKSHGRKTASDIAKIFKDEGISEKTVQRYLLDMVKEGRLKAEGEKRWRVYYISDLD